jgi:hypothetical protein
MKPRENQEPEMKTQMNNSEQIKQMKTTMNIKEHAVVTTAARMQGITVAEYMKKAVINKAKEDAKDFSEVIKAV